MTSPIDTEASVKTSYMDRSTVVMSRKDMVLLAWGSRSMRRVFFCRSANAAARLIAVVVLPTPPFWLAIDMTMECLPPFRKDGFRSF